MREPTFLTHPRLPPSIKSSVAKVTMPPSPLDDAGVIAHLAPHKEAAVIEIDMALGKFCGFQDTTEHATFLRETERVLEYERVPFCTMEGSNNAPLYSRCCTPWHEGEKFFPCEYGFGKPPPLPACAAK